MTISNSALCVQIAGISILFFLFVFLARHDKRLYLRYWTVSWFLYAASLAILLVSFLQHRHWLYAVYQLLDLTAAGMITAAGMNFAYEFRLQKRHALFLIPALVWAAAGAWQLVDFNGLYAFHSFLMASAFAYNAYVFFSSKCFRENVGTRLLAVTCTLISVMDFHYVFIFGYAFHQGLGSIGYLQYTSFYDLLMQYVVAIGMVVIELQESQHRLEAANSQLKQAQDRLCYLAQIDPLTGVYNRHAFREICNQEFGVGGKSSVRHTLVLLDVNNLKQVNDLASHSMGDEVLRTVSRSIASLIRGEDHLVRWGGDEFLLMMCDTDRQKAEARMNLLMEHMNRQYVSSPAGKIYFGISFGCAEIQSIDRLAAAIEEANCQMYKQKQSTRKKLTLV